MEKKLVYLAHPITGSEDRTQSYNMACICIMFRHLAKSDAGVVPFAPYFAAMEALDNFNPHDRLIGLELNQVFFERNLIDELWVCGKKSAGVVQEIEWATKAFIPVVQKDLWAYDVFKYVHGEDFANKWRE